MEKTREGLGDLVALARQFLPGFCDKYANHSDKKSFYRVAKVIAQFLKWVLKGINTHFYFCAVQEIVYDQTRPPWMET